MKLYITPQGLNNNIIFTQLYLPLSYLSQDNDDIKMLVHSDFKNYVPSPLIRIDYFDSLFSKINFVFSYRHQISNIYTRSIFDFYLLYFLKVFLFLKFKIRYDYRGLLSQESYLRNGSFYKKRILEFFENLILKIADSVSTVSNNFKDYLISINSNRDDIVVTPCCTISVNKREKNKNEKIQFVYVGSLGKWQNFEEMLTTYYYINTLIPNSELSVITNDVDRALKICNNYGVLAKVFSVNNAEINSILAKFDFGFLLRDNILLNNVASPVKFLEYTSNGVIPIISEGVGDYSKIVKEKKMGLVINDKNDITKNSLLDLLNDDFIYERLYDFSNDYIWKNHYLNFRMY
jgi:hypothetical protein